MRLCSVGLDLLWNLFASVTFRLHQPEAFSLRRARSRIARERICVSTRIKPLERMQIETGSTKVDAIRLTDGYRLKGLFGYLSCGALYKEHFSTNGS